MPVNRTSKQRDLNRSKTHDRRRISPTYSNAQNTKDETSKNKIAKALKKKTSLTCKQILSLLKYQTQFIGCFAQDRLHNLYIQQLIVLLLVNIDSHSSNGSHWIALGIFSNSIEIFDPLGFKIYDWKSVPCELFEFIQKMSENRQIKLIKQIQPMNSILCTYNLIYIFLRKKFSFEKIFSLFSKKIVTNDKKLKLIIKNTFRWTSRFK